MMTNTCMNQRLHGQSDNGPEGNSTHPGSAGKLRGRKRDLYEGGIRVPGIVEWPGTIKPGQTDFPAFTSDYLPTILDLLGLELQLARELDGVSLMPVLEDPALEREQPMGFLFVNRGRSRHLPTQTPTARKVVRVGAGGRTMRPWMSLAP